MSQLGRFANAKELYTNAISTTIWMLLLHHDAAGSRSDSAVGASRRRWKRASCATATLQDGAADQHWRT